MKFDRISIVFGFVALARLLYGLEGTISHYMFHFDDFAIAAYTSAAVGVLIAIAFLLPLSKRAAIVFAVINSASGIAGLLIMGWLFATGEDTETNPILAPLVSAIVFSALLYLKPILRENRGSV